MLIVASNYLTTAKLCLTMFFFQKLNAIAKISNRWTENKHKTIETAEMLKIPMANPLFKNIVINT